MQRALGIIEPLMLVLVLPVLAVCAYFNLESATLICVAMVVLSMVPFFLRYERQKPRPRDIMPVVVLAAIAAVGRILFAAFPNFKPVSAIVIVCGIYFGRQSGFMCGALAAVASNMFFGQGMWLPWQMYGWGVIGYLAGTFQTTALFKNPVAVYIFGGMSSFLFGVLMDSWVVVSFMQANPGSALTTFAAGILFNISHTVSTVVFLLLILKPWGKKLQRLKDKYGVFADNR